ncbi:shikimate dehydrogenase [Nocardioides sp. NBC_00850]|uniref:shikimate dehydrogenase family protein n=1 Tax=Nocardioides sp. NBC_00850 TaxID=2976001 RepID=UPI00386EF802|nr:shikimate dehydrogenase [Nocardioides sp. NBC_00850]
MISGRTSLIAHLGYPTETFKSPMIFNPFFEKSGVDAIVVPMAISAADFPSFLPELCKIGNLRGALVTMPHKKSVLDLADEVSPTARIAGAANALMRRDDGRLVADMFDGAGFVRGVRRSGRELQGASALVVGAGGVGSAIAASLAAAGVNRMALVDTTPEITDSLADRLSDHYPGIEIRTGSADPVGYDLVVNATPLGMNEGDPLPIDMALLAPTTFVGEVVMKTEVTPFIRAARERGCRTQVGIDMLYEQIPALLEFFGFSTTTPEELRGLAQVEY